MKFHIETRQVVPAAYGNWTARNRQMLTHAATVSEFGDVASVLCRRVSVDNLDDRAASDPSAEPTCPQCQRAVAKIKQRQAQ